MTTPFVAKKLGSEEAARLSSANPGALTAAETALIADLARACDLLDERLGGPRPEADAA